MRNYYDAKKTKQSSINKYELKEFKLFIDWLVGYKALLSAIIKASTTFSKFS